ncbi:MAG: hypothetical protein IJ537_10110 [Bacteroidaceae bacterium]|nr:hypothetical protein [Bacteroidaceae bacterium]
MNKKVTSLLSLLVAVLVFTSCAAPEYLTPPALLYPALENICTFGVQNMDEKAKVENNALTCHYEGFDVKYKVRPNFVVSLEIINNSNKSLIIDKSKCYVLYNGYSTQLFKDVRSSRSTTFNNVQDAINNVQTNEAGVSMTVPPYSKWDLPLEETNLREIKSLPDFNSTMGIHSLSTFNNKETVEFVIPYSFDYSLAKWETSRNRIFVNSIEVKKKLSYECNISETPQWLHFNQYLVERRNGAPDYTEVRKINELNEKIYKKHNRKIKVSHIIWGTIFIPATCGLSALIFINPGCIEHLPPRYEDGTIIRNYY